MNELIYENDDYDGEEWKNGYISYKVKAVNEHSADLEFFNYEKKKFVILNDIDFKNIVYFTNETDFDETMIAVGKVYKFKVNMNGFDIDSMVFTIAVLVSAYGAAYNRKKYTSGDVTKYNYTSNGQIFCTSLLYSCLNYIRYIVLKNNRSEDFDKVLSVFEENINNLDKKCK